MTLPAGIPSLVGGAHNAAKTVAPKAGLPSLIGGENPIKSGTPSQIAAAIKATASAQPVVHSTAQPKRNIADMAVATPEAPVERPRLVQAAYTHDDKGAIWRNIAPKRCIGQINSNCTKAELVAMVAALIATVKQPEGK
jgi:hypothetical protein